MKPEIKDLAEGYIPPNITVKLGGREVVVYKMTLDSMERAVRLAEPYIKEIMNTLMGSETFTKAVQGHRVDREVAEVEIKDAFKTIAGEMVLKVPKTLMGILACVMNVPEEGPEWDFFWHEVSPADLMGCVEKLDDLNDFVGLGKQVWEAWKYLAKRYGVELPVINTEEGKTNVE